jgi:hypothetical protein
MGDTAQTNSSNKFFISTTPQNADLDDDPIAGFPGLVYTEVASVGSVGELGLATNILNYDTWASEVISKGKGLTDAGNADVEMLRIPLDPGQIAMRAAGATTNKNNYAFKIEMQGGTDRYFRALVAGPRHPGGRNEDFDLDVYTLGANQSTLDITA